MGPTQLEELLRRLRLIGTLTSTSTPLDREERDELSSAILELTDGITTVVFGKDYLQRP
jgi:hypothetical protein